MARRNRKFFFDNVRGKLLKDTNKGVKDSADEGLKVSGFADASVIHSTDSFSDVNTKFMTAAAIDDRIGTRTSDLVDSAPATLNTLNELAAALGDDASFSTTTATSLGNRLRIDVNSQSLDATQKSNAVTNLGLATVSTSGAYSDLTGTPTIPTNNNELTNGASYITGYTVTESDVTGHQAALSVTESQISDLGSYITGYTVTESDVTGHQAALSITESQISDLGSYSTFSGAYADLTGKPTIPTNNNQLTNGAGYITSADGGNATTLDSIDSGSFLRSDANDTMSSTLTMTGFLIGRNCTNATFTAANDAGSMSIRGDTSKPAVVSFHRSGAYAVQFGLDTDNHLKMGGWSATSIKHTWKNNGEYNAVGNVVAYSSDARLKTNIKNIPNSLEKVMSLNGVTFDWKEEVISLGFEPSRMHGEAGVLAQEVESVLPQATAPAPFDRENIDGEDVSKSGENYLTVQYEKIVPLLIEAIKEQQQQIDALKEMINGSSI